MTASPDRSQPDIVDKCKHDELCFHSGGHYIYCQACKGWWVARKGAHTTDESVDYDRSSKSDVIGGEVRVRRTGGNAQAVQEPLAWWCEDAIFPGGEVITHKELAEARAKNYEAWKRVVPLYPASTVTSTEGK